MTTLKQAAASPTPPTRELPGGASARAEEMGSGGRTRVLAPTITAPASETQERSPGFYYLCAHAWPL
ncbi:protein of unknown function [Methylacidimicrobium sp. AP8]|nr:protein of unknown function [Methylacidimicrobium sp. AP8]